MLEPAAFPCRMRASRYFRQGRGTTAVAILLLVWVLSGCAQPAAEDFQSGEWLTAVLPTRIASITTPVAAAGGEDGALAHAAQPTPAATRRISGSPDALRPLEPAELARLALPRNYRPQRASVFEGRLLVGLYGTPAGRGLGILGTTTATDTVVLAREQALAYQALLTDTQVVPFFHMVTTIADKHPGADLDYNHRVLTSTIQLWIDVARANGMMSVLDIQNAHSPITTELAYVESFLRQRGVHLAVDPEFMMPDATAIPGNQIGTTDGATINLVQAWLEGIARATGERKALIIHQFDDQMITGKELIAAYEWVDLVWDSDGFGGPGPKIADFQQYAAEPGFEYGGFKLFYDYDVPLMEPAAVLSLVPRPVFVVYQ